MRIAGRHGTLLLRTDQIYHKVLLELNFQAVPAFRSQEKPHQHLCLQGLIFSVFQHQLSESDLCRNRLAWLL